MDNPRELEKELAELLGKGPARRWGEGWWVEATDMYFAPWCHDNDAALSLMAQYRIDIVHPRPGEKKTNRINDRLVRVRVNPDDYLDYLLAVRVAIVKAVISKIKQGENHGIGSSNPSTTVPDR